MKLELSLGKAISRVLLAILTVSTWSCSQDLGQRSERLVQQLGVPQMQAMKRVVAFEELKGMGKQATPALLEGLKSDNIDIRFQCARLLGIVQDPVSKPALRELLQHDAFLMVQLAAASALGSMGDGSGYELATSALEADDEYERENAVIALGDIGDKRATPVLLKALRDPRMHDAEAALALGKIGDETAVEALIQVVKQGNWMAREYAAKALGMIGDERALTALKGALRDEEDSVREAASDAIRRIEDKQD